MKKLIKASLPLAIALGLVACGSSSSSDDDSTPDTALLSIDATNLQYLGDGFEYEGWIIVPGNDLPISTGLFDIDQETGEPTQSSFEIDLTQANAATAFVLTIEPANESPEDALLPADTKILGTALDNDGNESTGTATTDFSNAIGTDFADAAGTFILATPTNGNVTPNQGIWFLDRTPGPAVASLTLPDLNPGWVYEGWVVPPEDGATPISTGTFTDVSAADSDGPGLTAGPQGAPGYPGQDFIDPAIDLVGYTTVISVEPVPDNSSAPFILKPLAYANIDAAVLPPTEGTDDKPLNNIIDQNLSSAEITIEF